MIKKCDIKRHVYITFFFHGKNISFYLNISLIKIKTNNIIIKVNNVILNKPINENFILSKKIVITLLIYLGQR